MSCSRKSAGSKACSDGDSVSTGHLCSLLTFETFVHAEQLLCVPSCFELLDSCKFKEFWTVFKEIEGDADLKTLAASATNNLKQNIVAVLALSYKSAPIGIVKSALNVDQVDESMDHIEKVSGDEVIFTGTANNTKRVRVFQEGVKFSSISNIIVTSQ